MKVCRRFFSLLLASLVLAATIAGGAQVPAARAQGEPPVATPAAVVRTLPNGLRIAVLEDHAAPVVQVAIWYRFGSDDETPGKTGLAHGLEHMMFRGTPELSSAGLDDLGARLGGLFNANTTNDYTHFYFVVPADRMDVMLHVEADRMTHLKLSPSDWNTEKQAVLQEYDQDYSQPIIKLLFATNDALYPGTPYGKSALGTRADIVNATAADLKRYYDAWYAPNNATLVVTGDVRAADVFASAARWFGPIPRKVLPHPVLPVARPASGANITMQADYPFEVLDLAYALPGDDPANDLPLAQSELAILALQNARAPLRTALVNSGLALAFFILPQTTRHGTIAHALFIVAPGHTSAEVRAAYERSLARTAGEGVNADYLAAAKRQSISSLTYARDSITGLGNGIGSGYVFPGDTDPAKAAAIIESVTPDQATAALRTYFAQPNAAGIVTPTTTDPTKVRPISDFSGAIADDFSGRVPSGPIVQAPWVKTAITVPLALGSTVKPKEFTLPNGLRLLVQEVHSNPTVFISGFIREFEQADPDGKDGLGSITSSLLGAGSARYDFDAQRKLADDLGAQISYGQSFSAHGFAKDTGALLDTLADSVQHPLFPAYRLTLTKTYAATSLSRRGLDPNYRSSRAFAEALYPPGDPALRETTPESIGAITLDDVRAYHTTWYRPDLTTLVIVGDVDTAGVLAMVRSAFGDWSVSGPKPDPTLPPLPLPSPVAKIVEAATNDDAVELGSTALTVGNPDRVAFQLMNAILGGGGFDSRLMNEVRVNRGLVYSISSNLHAGVERGTWTLQFRSAPAKTKEALAVVTHEIERIQTEPVTQAELDRQRIRLTASTAIGEESTQAIVGDINGLARNGLPLDSYATLAKRYAAVTPADIERVAKTYLHPENLVEVLTGPKP